MRHLAALLALLAFSFIGLTAADEKPKEKPPVGALKPSPLDDAFEKAATERDINNALLNNDLYKKAVKAALEAKKKVEKDIKDNPRRAGATPAQAARAAFLRTLSGEDK